MFWRFGGYANISTLDTVLDKPDVTVEELLDESDLIQELKQNNSKLVEFLRDEAHLKKLLQYVTADKPPEDYTSGAEKKVESPKAEEHESRQPYSFFGGKGKTRSRSTVDKKDGDEESEQEKQEARRKKYAYVSCEVLSSEVWSIVETLLDQREHLREFWQYMHRPAPLDPLQAGYFTKVNETLLDKKTTDMLAFFKSLDGIVPAMLQHVDCPMVMDLLLKIISLEKSEGGAGIVDWLQSQDLIPLLLGYLSPEQTSATQTSAGDFLKAIITISANATTQDQSVIGPNELTRQLVSEPCIKTLISDMLRGGNPLTVGVGIIIEVIRKNNSDYDLESQTGPEPKTSDPIYLGTLLRQFANHVPDFMNLIRSSSAKKPDLKVAFGRSIEPLGFDRFKTCELMAELLHCSNMGLLNERGAEEDVRRRDAERERLKSEGKLAGTPKPPSTPSGENRSEEFGSSVDSHGFHHAERPSGSEDEMDEKDDSRKLEIQNASDDEFEKVNKPNTDDFPDEVSFDDEGEKVEHAEVEGLNSQDTPAQDAPKSPVQRSPIKQNFLHFDPPPKHSVDSPTTAGVTDRIDKLDVDEDTVMTEFGEERSDSDDDGPSELEKELARGRPEDKPAPLFVKKTEASASSTDTEEKDTDIGESVTTIQDESSSQPNGERAPYETEEDGTPVVGDLLKTQFVEHKVVATILDFFFRFPWNNFLHNVVYDVVQQVFNGTLERGYNRTLAFDLFAAAQSKDGESKPVETIGLVSTKDITDRILDGQRASDALQAERGMRLGYMGHLTLIAEEVCKFGNRDGLDPIISERLSREEWQTYVEGTLAETREKDNAVLGGVRPQDQLGMRGMGMGGLGGGFSSNTASTLASAGIGAGITGQDSLDGPMSTTFEINSGISSFADAEDDDEMEDEVQRRNRLEDDEQTQTSPSNTTIPPPLNIPSKARNRLAERLARKKAEAVGAADPDAADSVALEAAATLPEEPSESEGLIDLGSADSDVYESGGGTASGGLQSPGVGAGLQITGLRTLSGAQRFSGLFSDDSSSSSVEDDEDEGKEIFDEDEAGRDLTVGRAEGDYEDDDEAGGVTGSGRRRPRRRPSTTEAKERTPLDDGDDDEEDMDLNQRAARLAIGRSPFEDPKSAEGREGQSSTSTSSSDEDELVEIRPRRTSSEAQAQMQV